MAGSSLLHLCTSFFENELDKKAAAKEKLIGGVLDYRFLGKMNIGVIYYHASFDKEFASTSIYDLSGKSFNYFSTYYDINFSKISLFGEASYNLSLIHISEPTRPY